MPPDFQQSSPLVSLMGATFDTGNMGVSALTSGAVAAVRKALPGARIFLLDYGSEPFARTGPLDGGIVGMDRLNLRFSRCVWLPNHVARLLLHAFIARLIPLRSLRRRFRGRSPWLRRMVAADFHLSLAGGDSFSDIYGLRRLLYTALPQILVLLLEKPLILLPQTYGPFKTWHSRVLARMILRRARLVYSRDREGLEVVRALRGTRGPEAGLTADLGFALEALPPPREATERLLRFRAGRPLVGFNVSGLLHIGGYNRRNMFGLSLDYTDLVAALLDLFIGRRGATVLLVPHVLGIGPDSESDLDACRAVNDRFRSRWPGRLHLFEEPFSHRETKHLIGACDFFVGSRMHACIAALSQCVPAVGLAYSRKFAGVMDAAGGGAVVVDLRAVDLPAAVARVDAAWLDRDRMREQLLARIPPIRASALGLLLRPEFSEFLGSAAP